MIGTEDVIQSGGGAGRSTPPTAIGRTYDGLGFHPFMSGRQPLRG